MADIKKALKLLAELEYSNMPSRFLHKNKKEYSFTVGGVYTYQNPNALNVNFVQGIILACNKDIKRASSMLYHDYKLNVQIKHFCKSEVWDKMRLDEVKSQKIADELFLFAFHTHYITAAKVAQRVVNVEADGFIGTESLEALNSFDVNIFDMVYDEREDEHYKTIIERKPYLQENYNGWRARAYKV